MQRVLIVDDEPGIRSYIREVLEGEGLVVATASDGEEGRALLNRSGFHLMITDLRMPRLDGMTLVRKARAESPEMEVIVLTGNATVATAVEAMKLGAFDYLVKPLSGPDELRIVVSRAHPQAQPAPRGTLRGGQLCRAFGDAPRERDLRTRAGRIHGRERHAARSLRARRRRHALSRRDRRTAPGLAGEAAARAARPPFRTRRRGTDD